MSVEDRGERAEAGTFDRDAHSRALMLRRRCGHCAERVPATVLLRGQGCPHCGREVGWPAGADAESILAALDRRWRRRRWPAYLLVTLSAAATGFLPFLPTIVSVIFMVYVRLAILRDPVSWFGPSRRILTRVGLKLWLVTVGSVNLALVSVFALVPFANVVLAGLASLATSALFVEVALVYLRGRLRREAEHGPELEAWEWGVPAALVAGTAAAVGGCIYALHQAWTLVQSLLE